ncbi:two-component sensor histidine kinase [Chromatium okenii]|uniref:histidine kinase n=1 Tax=Chromatium okenii TaxID=61644 RepID=A0A2S7XSW3_9GAMM|nr:two-component sensor histidine kinase [Chromatium okenii]
MMSPVTFSQHPTWGALRWLFVFRCLILLGLIWVFSSPFMAPVIDKGNVRISWFILQCYSLLMLLGGLSLFRQRPQRVRQVQIAIFIDIVVYTLLMHTAGGIASGLGMLLAVAVAAAALMMEGRLSLLFAAIASLAVIAQQSYSVLQNQPLATTFTQAGLLGLLFFTVAVMAHVLYRRVRSAEALAARRKVDIDDLSKLNDFIIHSIHTGILVVDGERRLRLLNQAALDVLEVKQFRRGVALAALSPELDRWLARSNVSTPTDWLLHCNRREIRVSPKPLGVDRANGIILYLRDNQEVMKEAQQIKLAALGTLTASIAHNIRNPLSAMTHASQLLAENPALTDDDRHLLDIIRRNGARIEDTVHSVLQLSRRHQREPAQLVLATWLEEFAAEFCERHDLDPATLQLRLHSTAVTVNVDPRHLHQIIANLCENALIHGQRSGQSPLIILRSTGIAGTVQLAVCDVGAGIAPAVVNEIFNPFYTTKTNGTGLGLYIARELAETNGISLTYTPHEPRGSCFLLVFAG